METEEIFNIKRETDLFTLTKYNLCLLLKYAVHTVQTGISGSMFSIAMENIC